jgi:uncharacterized UBP type Zn finger protein
MKSILINEFENGYEMQNHRSFGQIPCRVGLPNNEQTTDYMNACIVSLCSSKAFVGLFGSKQFKALVWHNNGLLLHFSNLVTMLYCNDTKQGDIFKLKFRQSFLGHVKNVNGLFDRNMQGDAQFFLVHLIQWLRSDLKRFKGQEIQLTPETSYFLRDTLSCLKNFFIDMKRITRCSNGHITYKEGTGKIIEIDVEDDDNTDFATFIVRYFQEIQSNEFPCPFCRTTVKASHRFTLTFLPDTIMILVNANENTSVSINLSFRRSVIKITVYKIKNKINQVQSSLLVDFRKFLDGSCGHQTFTTYELSAFVYKQESYLYGRFQGIIM